MTQCHWEPTTTREDVPTSNCTLLVPTREPGGVRPRTRFVLDRPWSPTVLCPEGIHGHPDTSFCLVSTVQLCTPYYTIFVRNTDFLWVEEVIFLKPQELERLKPTHYLLTLTECLKSSLSNFGNPKFSFINETRSFRYGEFHSHHVGFPSVS